MNTQSISDDGNHDTSVDQTPEGDPISLLGTVYRKNLGQYDIRLQENGGGRTIACALSAKLRKVFEYSTADPNSVRRRVRKVEAIKHIDPLAVGDQVRLLESADGTGLIVERLPRRNKLVRKSATPMPGAHAFEQVIVANLDRVVAVFAAARPNPKWNLLDRYLVAAESLELPALVCVTKLDLAQNGSGRPDPELASAVEEYQRIGYPVVLTSAVSGEGLDELRAALRGRLSVFVGKSGVGKSTLLNALQPGLGLRVGQVSERTGKGRHTTSHLEMFPLDFGGSLVDTPGTREFGLWDLEQDDLAWFFPEMRPYIGACRFGASCQHDAEPGCAVRVAVMRGEISPRRYQSYLRLQVDA